MRFLELAGLVVAMLLASSAASYAQYGAPYGSPGVWTAPEVTNGAFGAGAANSSYCSASATARDGPRNQCSQTPPPDPRPRR